SVAVLTDDTLSFRFLELFQRHEAAAEGRRFFARTATLFGVGPTNGRIRIGRKAGNGVLLDPFFSCYIVLPACVRIAGKAASRSLPAHMLCIHSDDNPRLFPNPAMGIWGSGCDHLILFCVDPCM